MLRWCFGVLLTLLFLPFKRGLQFSITPQHNAFFVNTHHANLTSRQMFLQNSCASSSEQQVTVTAGNRVGTTRLISALPNLYCAVSVTPVDRVVQLDRPYVDVVAVGDMGLLSFHRQTVCVSVQIISPSADIVRAQCQLSPFEGTKESCLIRVQVPFSWFGTIGINATKRVLSLSHTVSTTCSVPFYERPLTSIQLLPHISKVQAHTLIKQPIMDLSLLSRANVSFRLNSLNSLFLHLSQSKNAELTSIEIRLYADARLEMVNVAPMSPEAWEVRVSSAVRPQLFTSFLCTLKTKDKSWDGYLLAILVKTRGLVSDARRIEREGQSEAILHWEIHYNTTLNKKEVTRVVTKFRVHGDAVHKLLPIPKSNEVINTGVFSSKQSSIPMRVFTVSQGAVLRDVTASSHCISQEAKVLKTSPTCTTVYVDGSELRGLSTVQVHVHYEKWTTSVDFSVWFPKLPVKLWVRDTVLNTIEDWPVAVWKTLKSSRQKRSARQFACGNRFQQTELLVLASFQMSDERTGEERYMTGDKNSLVDVTALVATSLLSSDRSVVTLRKHGNRMLVQPNSPGIARIMLKKLSPGINYGATTVTVSTEPVKVRSLSILPVVDISLYLDRQNFALTANIEQTFTHRYQHGGLMVLVEFTDEAVEVLEDVLPQEFLLNVHSSDPRVLAVNRKTQNYVDLIAVDDLTDPSLEVELRPPSQCADTDDVLLSTAAVPLSVQFNELDSTRFAMANMANNITRHSRPLPPESRWRLEHWLLGAILLISLLLILRLLARRATAFHGYEKLVAPLLSRLSSSSSSGRDRDEEEWVWMSRGGSNVQSATIGSRYSQKSTLNHRESPSYDDNTQTSISYRGSEISVFISPTPVITVHGDRGDSWRSQGGRGRRIARQALVDSNSEHNLARVLHSNGSWRDPDDEDWRQQAQTWNAKRRHRQDIFRESVA